MSRRSSPRVAGIAVAIVLLPVWAIDAQAQWRFDPDTGWTNPRYSGSASARDLAAKAKKLEADKDHGAAAKAYEQYANKYPQSSAAADALFAAAENQYRAGELYAAYEAYEEYRKRHGTDRRFALMLRRRHEVGRALIVGRPVGSMGITWLSAEEKGEQILRAVIEDAPAAKFDDKDEIADDAMFDVGSYCLREHRYDEAETMFERLRHTYPRSEWVQSQQATYLIGRAQLERAGNDPKKLAEAQRSFSKVEHAKQKEGPSKLGDESRNQVAKIAEDLAEKDFQAGEFYRRQGRSRAARRYYESVLAQYPDSLAAGKSRNALATLRSGGS